ncbi:MAG: 23S rRNA (uracil(1939)-C(5))-methyltransferase RlmD [Desulfobacteraceae bacterium]|nr:MAG: 23S rRNA (uracil(1939)-C(5))-methyltransferase RlmD [Desulfobacteraceae bacterium]
MGLKKGGFIELEVTGMAFGGKGLAKVDGLAVFVEKAVPLDRIKARILKKKKKFAEAVAVELIEPSPYRTNPPCEYSGFCGGCRWQFLEYDRQLQYKRQHVEESLEHIGLIRDVPVHPTIPSEKIFGYRNKMEFSCSDRKWLIPSDFTSGETSSGFALGLHVPGTFDKVLDIRACLLQPEEGNMIFEDAKAFMKKSGIPPYGIKSHEGFWRFLMLRNSAAYGHWMVNIITSTENRKTLEPLAALLSEKYPDVVSVINNITSSKAAVATGEYETVLSGSPFIKDKIGNFEFEISANSFFQTNTISAEILYKKVKEFSGLSGSETVLDLYSGTGTIPVFLSADAGQITGIEIVESAVLDAEKNCRSNGVSNCTFILGDIRESLSEISKKPEVIIIDPPRVGMHKDVVKLVMDMAPERIVYVSCNPATLARDLFLMKESYKVEEVQPVDMFPHTWHIESVARLQKKRQL